MIPEGPFGAFDITRFSVGRDMPGIAEFCTALPEKEQTYFTPDMMQRMQPAIERGRSIVSIVRAPHLAAMVAAIVFEFGPAVQSPNSRPSIFVHAHHRRQGIATTLHSMIVERDRTAGFEALLSNVAADDKAAIGFLESCGYQHEITDLEMRTPLEPLEDIPLDGLEVKLWDGTKGAWSDQIAELYNLHFTRKGLIPRMTGDEIAARATDPKMKTLVAIDPATNTLQGYLDYYDDEFVNSIVIRRRDWGKRVADGLVMELKRRLKALDKQAIKSSVSPHNAASMRLHKAMGAEEVNRFHGYRLPL